MYELQIKNSRFQQVLFIVLSFTNASFYIFTRFLNWDECFLQNDNSNVNASPQTEKLVAVQLLFFIRLFQTSVLQPPLPLFSIQSEQEHQAGPQQIAGPTVNFRTFPRKVGNRTACCRGDGVRRRAVPKPASNESQIGEEWWQISICTGLHPTAWKEKGGLIKGPKSEEVPLPPPTTHQLSLPVNNDRRLHAFLGYLLCRDVVPQSVEGSTDERRLPIKEGSPRGQAVGRGSQECGPKSLPQRLGQSGLPCERRKDKNCWKTEKWFAFYESGWTDKKKIKMKQRELLLTVSMVIGHVNIQVIDNSHQLTPIDQSTPMK